jgi:hypothetical protein
MDIRLTEEQRQLIYGSTNLRALGTIEDDSIVGLWRAHYNNSAFEVPVRFGENDDFEGTNQMSDTESDAILVKLRAMEVKLGNIIRFVVDFDVSGFQDGYIRLGNYGSGCYSYVGRLPSIYQPQVINIGTGCAFTDLVEHEMMHALGFFHEQSRPDRDNYVVVHWDNIPTAAYGNFEIAESIDSRDSPYDTRSVMHYDNYAFAIDGDEPTMSAVDTDHPTLGGALTMSSIDITQLRMLYRCTDGPRESFNTNCVSACPCREAEGVCTVDGGCTGALVCDTQTHTCETNHSAPSVSSPTPFPTTISPPTPVTPVVVQTTEVFNVGLVAGLAAVGILIISLALFY